MAEEGTTANMKNNYFLVEDFNTSYPIIVSILMNHPLSEALTRNEMVPEKYLLELWDTISYVKPTRSASDHFLFQLTAPDEEGVISVFNLTFDVNYFREAVGFPAANSVPGKQDFDDIPTERVMLQGIMDLGYEEHLTAVGAFQPKSFSRLWCTMFAILSRCLSPSERGADAMTKTTLKIMYGVAYNQHFDYAGIIWNQMVTLVKGKHRQQRSYVPFKRFFTLVLHHFIEQFPYLQPAEEEQIVYLHSLKFLQANAGSSNVRPTNIPEHLLALLDRNAPVLVAYRAIVAPPATVQPQEPAQGAHRSPGEGSRKREKKKESKGKRKEGDLGDDVPVSKKRKANPPLIIQEPTASQVHSISPQQQPEVTEPPRHKRVKTVAQRSHKPSQHIYFPDSDDEPETTESDAPVSSPTPISSTINIPQVTPEAVTVSTSGNDDSDQAFVDNIFSDYEQPPEHDYETHENVDFGEQGGNEGGVEKLREVERSGSEKESKEKDDSPQTNSQSTTLNAQTPLSEVPSHSDSSPQELVSSFHGENPRRTLPHLPSSLAQQFSLSRTLSIDISLRDIANLRGIAGTSLGSSVFIGSRGYEGRPTSAIDMPTLNVGLTSSVGRTLDSPLSPHPRIVELPGSQSGPGMLFTHGSSDHGPTLLSESVGVTSSIFTGHSIGSTHLRGDAETLVGTSSDVQGSSGSPGAVNTVLTASGPMVHSVEQIGQTESLRASGTHPTSVPLRDSTETLIGTSSESRGLSGSPGDVNSVLTSSGPSVPCVELAGSTERLSASGFDTLPRTVHLRGVPETTVGTSLRAPQGSVGSPAMVNTVLTMSAGLMTSSSESSLFRTSGTYQEHQVTVAKPTWSSHGVIESTGPLREPGTVVSQRIEPGWKARFDSQTHSIPSSSTQTLHSSQTQISSSFKTSIPSFQSSPIARPSLISNLIRELSIDEIQQMHLEKLRQIRLSSELSSDQQLLFDILNNSSLITSTSPQPSQPIPSQQQQSSQQPSQSQIPSDNNQFKEFVLTSIQNLTQRVTALESCRPSALSSSHRHDDHDSEDPHEGENRGSGVPQTNLSSDNVVSTSQGVSDVVKDSGKGKGVQDDLEKGIVESASDDDNEDDRWEYYGDDDNDDDGDEGDDGPTPLQMIKPFEAISWKSIEEKDVQNDELIEQGQEVEFERVHVDEEVYDQQKEVVNVSSDDDFDINNLFPDVKEEEVDEMETEKIDQTKDTQPETSTAHEMPTNEGFDYHLVDELDFDGEDALNDLNDDFNKIVNESTTSIPAPPEQVSPVAKYINEGKFFKDRENRISRLISHIWIFV